MIAEELRMTLVWYDPPALLSAASQLVNDLDVSLRFLDDRATMRPWGLAGDGPAPDHADDDVDGHDRVNTVEHLRVPVGQPGGAALLQVGLGLPGLGFGLGLGFGSGPYSTPIKKRLGVH